LAKAEKYNIQFQTPDGITCTVRFLFEGFTGTATTLTGGTRPFVLREFNTDDDLFKPIRPQMAEIEILTNSSGVTIEDFYADNDSDILVSFTIGLIYYWNGYLLQDDFQENWSDQNHIITVRATEGFGYLKNQQLSDGGLELQGLFTPKDILGYAIAGTSSNFFRLREFNNLYHDSMTTTLQSPLDQCYINAKTFATEANQYEDCYTVIEKINRSWNQTIFMWRNYWVIMRMEELYTPPTNNLKGLYFNLGGPFAINTRYDINVNSTSDVKPIEPSMIKMIRKKTKQDEVDFSFQTFDEILENESFIRGTISAQGVTYKEYSLDGWTHYAGTLSSPTTPDAYNTLYVRETYASGLQGALLERYAYTQITPLSSQTSTFFQSNSVKCAALSRLNFSVEHRQAEAYSGLKSIAWVTLKSGSLIYYLGEDGKWDLTSQAITYEFGGGDGLKADEWNSFDIESDIFPIDGDLQLSLIGFYTSSGLTQINYFKNLKFDIKTSFSSDERSIIGQASKYIKTDNINNNSLNQIWMDDDNTEFNKGAIFESDGITLTDRNWSRYRFPGESFGFRRQNATAYWEHNRVNRTKVDATFFGLFNGSVSEPIGLINTVIFSDDDPDKVYAIANMKEIDFSSGIWQATLEEVYDTNRDTLTSQNFAASWTLGTYASPTKIPATLTTSGGFSIQSNTDIRWDGGASITKTVTVSINGTLKCASYPTTINMTLKLNSTTLKNQPYVVYVDNQSFTFNMSATGTVTIAPGDIITLNITSATSITVGGGTISIPSGQQGLTYDPYYDEFIQQ
jgi:hypothetical protein